MEVSWRDYVDLRFQEWEKTHANQNTSAQRALDTAEEQLREWKIEHNNFQRQIEQERALYVRRDSLDAVVKLHNADVERLVVRLETLETWKANLVGRLLVFGGAIVVISGIVTAALRLVGH